MTLLHWRRTIKAAALAAYVWLALSAVGGIVLSEKALRLPVRRLDPTGADAVRRQAAGSGTRIVDVRLQADDGVDLRGWTFEPARANGDGVLLLHGQADNRLGVAGTAVWLASEGYTIVAPDSRGHGESGAALVTYGVREAPDARRWIDLLRARVPDGCVYVVGQSMGAAVGLQALPWPGVCGAIGESPFASFTDIAHDRVGAALGLRSGALRPLLTPLVQAGVFHARLTYGIDLASARPAAAARAGVPILLVHGLDDVNIPPRHSLLIQSDRPHISVWLVPGAAHTRVWHAAADAHRARVLAFLRERLPD